MSDRFENLMSFLGHDVDARWPMAGLLMAFVSLIVAPGIAQTWAEARNPATAEETRQNAIPKDAPTTLAKGGTVEGTVLSQEGAVPIADASVWIERWGESERHKAVRNLTWKSEPTKTDSSGRFVISNVPDGQLRLHARGKGFAENHTPEFTVGRTERKPIDLRLFKGVSLTVVVLDVETKRPLPGSVVSFEGVAGERTTNEAGTCVFPNMSTGEHFLLCRARGYRDPTYKQVAIGRTNGDQELRVWMLSNRAASAKGGNREHLLGWFKLPKLDNRLIPVFKCDKTYYTVTRKGFEVPLKECPEGLDCSGTVIGFDKASGEYFFRLVDPVRTHMQPEFVNGERQPMTKIDEAPKLLDPTAEPPHTNEDFVGWYQPVWFPAYRIEIRKDGEKRLLVYQSIQRRGVWKTEGENVRNKPAALKPYPNRLGFVLSEDKHCRMSIAYNEARKCYEFVFESLKKDPSDRGRIPLTRISPSPDGSPMSPFIPILPIGIPYWD